MLERTTLKDQAYREIKKMLTTGEIAAGESISETALIAKLGVSRTPVREALLALASEGLLDGSSYAGMKVHTLTNREREEVIQIRSALEKLALRKLAPVVTQQHIDHLRATIDRQSELVDSEDALAFLEADADFHLSIARSADVMIVQRILRNMRELFYLLGVPAVAGALRREAIVREHRLILDSLSNGDIYESLAALDDHLDQTLLRASELTGRVEDNAVSSTENVT